MKKISTIIIIVTLFSLQNSFAISVSYPTVQEQLENLNKNWKDICLDYSILKERVPLTNDVSIIQMHLSLVEKTLRNKNVDNLSTEQKQNRKKCLDILHKYWTNGVFPKNLFHAKRTPYFIDKFGTACAVGQLIISTGYGEFAKKVMNENNNAYISELNSKYPEINKWATMFGFTIDELAWIQPCYCFSPVPGIVHVTCNGGSDGSFMPIVTGWPAPYNYEGWYWWSGSAWNMLMCGGCNLSAGNYKCVVIDADGASHDYFATITQPPVISQTISHTNDNGSCNGSAIVVVNGGTPGYTYSWSPGGYTNDTITNLCMNTYSLIITDNNGCISTETLTISFATKIEEISKSLVTIFPNPISKEMNFVLRDFFHPDKTFASIYNSQGQLIIFKKFESSDSFIDLSKLDNGIYIIRIDNGKQVENHQFIKNN